MLAGSVGCVSALAAYDGVSGSSQPTMGAVSVLYAGSLVNLMEHDLGPAFARTSGYTYEGVGAGSTQLVAAIKSDVRQGDVFISASPEANDELRATANGSYVNWYVTFATAPLVLAYNASSAFAAQLRSMPWYEVVTQPGISVGRTDPTLDPKGKLTVDAVDQAAATLSRPGLAAVLSSFRFFPEETLVGRLESGQLDAGFLYANEATEQHIPTAPLSPATLSATYTVTVLNNAPHARAGEAFVAYLLGPTGRAMLTRHGLTLLTPALTGPSDAVPAGLRPLVASP